MGMLKLEINMADIGMGDYSFEEAIANAVHDALYVKVREKINFAYGEVVSKKVKPKKRGTLSRRAIEAAGKNKIKEQTSQIAINCIEAVEAKLQALVNEDIVIDDQWGEPKFVGSVEDYIKQEIDKRMKRAVDDKGKSYGKSKSCQTGDRTYIDWVVQRKTEVLVEQQRKNMEREFKKLASASVAEMIKEFTGATLTDIITDKLSQLGVK